MKKVIQFAFKQSMPVLFGYLFAGMAFGLLLQKAGYHFLWALFISIIVYAGSMQFILVTILSSVVSLPSVIITTLAVNSRHIFYGLSFIEKFKSMGRKRWYMIFSLTDETYTLLCSQRSHKGIDEKKLYFLIALFDHCYWITGCVLGALIGSIIKFDTTGAEFAMTALFIVTFVEQWIQVKKHTAALVGLGCGIVTLMLFGADNFILPALIGVVVLLLLLQNRTINKEEEETADNVRI